MAGKKNIYIRFDQRNYVGTRSELLKSQMEVLYLKKMIKNLALTRAKKSHYRQLLEETFTSLKKRVESLDGLMPEDGIPMSSTPKEKPRKKASKSKPKPVAKSVEISIKRDEIDEELLRIKQKLDKLNNL